MNYGHGASDPVHRRRPRHRHPVRHRHRAGRRTGWTALVAVLVLAPMLPAAAAAQEHRVSVTGYLGRAFYGDLADSAAAEVTLESGGFYGVQAEYWFGRLGLRLHGGLGSTNLDGEPGTSFDLVAGDADLVVRFRRPRPGLFFQPYGFLGFGAIRYDLGPDTSLVAGFPYESDPTVKGTFVLGVGSDFVDGPLGFRVELMDIIGFSSPLSRTDTSHFGPVSHVVLTLGLSVRTGRIELRPPPARAPVRRQPLQPERRDTVRTPPADTGEAAPDSIKTDTVVAWIPPQRPAPEDTTAPAAPTPEPPDTTRVPPPGEPGDTAGAPVDTTGAERPRPPPVDPTVGPGNMPTDTVRELPPPGRRDSLPRRPTEPRDTTPVPPTEPTDTTPVEPPDTTPTEPPDTVGEPVDTTDTGDGETRGRLFTVRLAWDDGDRVQASAHDALVGVLQRAGVPVWPPEPAGEDDDEALTYRRVGALGNAADARTLGNHVEAEYGLAWEWVHIEKDEEVAPESVEASTAFVDTLSQGPGRGGRGGRPGGVGGGPADGSGGPGDGSSGSDADGGAVQSTDFPGGARR